MSAAIKAAEVVDHCVGRILEKVKSIGGQAIITADHGNSEKMWDAETQLPYTSHTTGYVPLVVFSEPYKNSHLREGGLLADIAPTVLEMMGLDKPEEMTGQSLFKV